MTENLTATDVRTLPLMPAAVWPLCGVVAVASSFIGLHVMHPPGAPEHMTDAQVLAWAGSGSTQIALGGSLGLIAAVALLAFGEGWAGRLVQWGAAPWTSHLARSSAVATATLLGLASILQVMAGLVATSDESVVQPTLLPTLVSLYGNVNVAVWVLLLPAVAAGVQRRRGVPWWAVVTSSVLGTGLALTILLPPVSWAPAFAWILAIAIGSVLDRPR